jgi:hypothetical protein
MTDARKRLAEVFLVAIEGRPFLRDIALTYEMVSGQNSFCGMATNPRFRDTPPDRRPLRVAAAVLLAAEFPDPAATDRDHEIIVLLSLDSEAPDGVAITITRNYIRSLWDTRSV